MHGGAAGIGEAVHLKSASQPAGRVDAKGGEGCGIEGAVTGVRSAGVRGARCVVRGAGCVVRGAACVVLAVATLSAQDAKPHRINRAIELLEQGQPIYYTGSHEGTDGSFERGVKDAQTYADYISYDMEHAPFDVKGLSDYMSGLAKGGPTKSGHRTPAIPDGPPVASPTVAAERRRILIVDDNLLFLEAARDRLEQGGLRVVGVAATSAEALRRAEELRPEIVLVDIMLGSESGFELARRLAAQHHEDGPAVILISTYSAADYAGPIADSPAAGFLPKQELSADAIRRIVDGGGPGGASGAPAR